MKLHLAVLAIFLLSAPSHAADKTAAHPAAGQKPAVPPTPFVPACSKPAYPAPAPAGSLEIDAKCGLTGAGTAAEGEQDAVKNNFCASGDAQSVSVDDLLKLQAKVEENTGINFGDVSTPTRKKGPTTNREPLRQLGEGTLVKLKAYVLIGGTKGQRA